MRIGFDAKRAVQNFTGLGNYSRYLIEILYRFYPENEYFLYAPHICSNPRFNHLLTACPSLSCISPKGLWKKCRSAWRSIGITRSLEKDHITIYHGLSNELPLNIRKATHTRSVVTIHDLIFLRYPQCYPPIDRFIYTYKFRKACQDANAIVAISQCTKQDIIHYFGIDADKIHVIYQGCDEVFTHPAPEQLKQEAREKYHLPAKYILCVGSIEERKNALLAVKAMPGIPEDIHLVLVGKRTNYTNQIDAFIKSHRLEKRVHLLHDVTFQYLPAIYQQAEIFVYPSRFEGFGIPIIEALHSAIPVIAATGSCLEEAGGPDSLYVRPDDKEGMTKAICSLLNHPEKRQHMIEQGLKYVTRFSEQRQAEELMNLYRSLTEEKTI